MASSPSTLHERSGPEYTDTQGPFRLLPALRLARAGWGRCCSDAEAPAEPGSPAADAHTEAVSSASMEDAMEGASCCRGSAMAVRLLAKASPAPSCERHQVSAASCCVHPLPPLKPSYGVKNSVQTWAFFRQFDVICLRGATSSGSLRRFLAAAPLMIASRTSCRMLSS